MWSSKYSLERSLINWCIIVLCTREYIYKDADFLSVRWAMKKTFMTLTSKLLTSVCISKTIRTDFSWTFSHCVLHITQYFVLSFICILNGKRRLYSICGIWMILFSSTYFCTFWLTLSCTTKAKWVLVLFRDLGSTQDTTQFVWVFMPIVYSHACRCVPYIWSDLGDFIFLTFCCLSLIFQLVCSVFMYHVTDLP